MRKGKVLTDTVLRHEEIHTRQMREMLYAGFYACYLAEWLVRLFMPGNAYRKISFEREAYQNEHDADYLKNRGRFAWLKYYRKRD